MTSRVPRRGPGNPRHGQVAGPAEGLGLQWLEAVAALWPGVTFCQRADGSFAFISPRIAEWTGVPAGAWARSAAAFWSAVHEADLAEVEAHLARAARTAEPKEGTFRFRHATTGEVVCIRERRRMRAGAAGGPVETEGLWLDATPERRLQQRLEHAHRHEVLCKVLLGFAHDFNNFAAGVLPLTDPQHGPAPDSDSLLQTLAWVHHTVKEASQAVHRLSQLAQPSGGERTYHDLNDILADIHPLLRRTISRRVVVTVAPAACPVPVFLEASALVRVLLDLVLNATAAMPKGGTLTLRAWLQAEGPSGGRVCGVMPRPPLAGLMVQDTGGGLRAADLERLFEPGFSTRPENAGLGLGLPHAARFAEQNGGAISVETPEGLGTTVTLWLPLADLEAATPATPAGRSGNCHGTGAATAAATSRRPSLLWVGEFDAAFERLASAMWCAGLHAGRAADWAVAERWLRAQDHGFRAVVLPVPAEAAEQERLFEFLLQSKGRLKTVLRLPAGGGARVPDELQRAADTTILDGAAEAQAIASLRDVLTVQPPAASVGQPSRLPQDHLSEAPPARPEATPP